MSYIDKAIGIAGVGSTINSMTFVRRFLSGIRAVIALTAISCTLAGMILTVGFYVLYLALMHYGLDQPAAAITVCGFAFIVTAALGIAAILRWREFQSIPQFVGEATPIVSQVGRIVEAFMSGLLTERAIRRR